MQTWCPQSPPLPLAPQAEAKWWLRLVAVLWLLFPSYQMASHLTHWGL